MDVTGMIVVGNKELLEKRKTKTWLYKQQSPSWIPQIINTELSQVRKVTVTLMLHDAKN